MHSPLTPTRLHKPPIGCALLMLHLPACTYWHTGTPTPAQFVEKEHPETIRVTLTDSTTLTVTSPAIQGDSLVGSIGNPRVWRDVPRPVSIALSDVGSVAVQKTDAGRTMLALVAGMAASLRDLNAITSSSGYPRTYRCRPSLRQTS